MPVNSFVYICWCDWLLCNTCYFLRKLLNVVSKWRDRRECSHLFVLFILRSSFGDIYFVWQLLALSTFGWVSTIHINYICFAFFLVPNFSYNKHQSDKKSFFSSRTDNDIHLYPDIWQVFRFSRLLIRLLTFHLLGINKMYEKRTKLSATLMITILNIL